MKNPSYEQVEKEQWVYCPRGVKWFNTGGYVPQAEALKLGATNIRPAVRAGDCGMIADWPQASFDA